MHVGSHSARIENGTFGACFATKLAMLCGRREWIRISATFNLRASIGSISSAIFPVPNKPITKGEDEIRLSRVTTPNAAVRILLSQDSETKPVIDDAA